MIKIATFNNIYDLEKFIKQQTLDIIKKDISKTVKDILKEYVNELVYVSNNSSEYERTFELLNSITISDVKKVNDGYEIKVFFDTKKIHALITAEDKWNAHADIHGKDVSSMIPIWMESGTKGGLFNRKGARFTEATYEYFLKNNKHIVELKNRLKSRGIIAK